MSYSVTFLASIMAMVVFAIGLAKSAKADNYKMTIFFLLVFVLVPPVILLLPLTKGVIL